MYLFVIRFTRFFFCSNLDFSQINLMSNQTKQNVSLRPLVNLNNLLIKINADIGVALTTFKAVNETTRTSKKLIEDEIFKLQSIDVPETNPQFNHAEKEEHIPEKPSFAEINIAPKKPTPNVATKKPVIMKTGKKYFTPKPNIEKSTINIPVQQTQKINPIKKDKLDLDNILKQARLIRTVSTFSQKKNTNKFE